MSGPAAPLPRDEAARLLGVAPDAPPAEVQRTFLRAARSVHPDRLPHAGESERRAAGIAFARLLQARDALLAEAPQEPAAASALDPRPRERGLGGSLVVLALLAFLLVAIVTAQQALPGDPGGPAAPPAATIGP